MRRARRQVYASPVDTSINYGQADEAPLVGLARSLAAIEPSLQDTLNRWDARKTKEAESQAMADVMAGKAPDEDQGKAYFRFYNQQKGRLTALDEFPTAFRTAYAEAGLQASDDPKAYREWVGQFREQWLAQYEDADPDFKEGMMPLIEQSIQNMGSYHAARLQENVMQGQAQLFQDEGFLKLTQLYQMGADPARMAAEINAHNDRFLPLLGGSKVNEMTIQAVTEAAIQAGDTSLLEVLDHTVGGSGPLSKTRLGKTAIARAEEAILSKTFQMEDRAWTRQQRQRSEQQHQMEVDVSKYLVEGGELSSAVIAERGWDKIPGLVERAVSVERALNSTTEGTTKDNLTLISGWTEFHKNPTVENLTTMISEGKFSDNPTDIKQAMTMANKRETSPTLQDALESHAFKETYRGLMRVLDSADLDFQEKIDFEPVVHRFMQEAYRVMDSEEYLKSSPIQQLQTMQALQEDAFVTSGMEVPQEFLLNAKERFELRRKEQEKAEANAENPALEPPADYTNAFSDLLTPVDPAQALPGDGEARKPQASRTNTVGGTLGSVLDFVASGESGGRYNVIWDGGNGTEVEFDKMTLSQVVDFQRNWTGTKGKYSSAAGRYQFVRKTLTGLVEKYDIPWDTPFTPDTQDALAILLMNDMGLGAYLSGRITPERFAFKLATQWAALPKDASGSGVYDKTKHNKSNRKWGEYISLVRNMKPVQNPTA
jgi:hypothetical protein